MVQILKCQIGQVVRSARRNRRAFYEDIFAVHLGSIPTVAQWLLTRKVSISWENKAVLLLFATFQTKHAQICTELHRELPAAPWSLEFYCSIILNLWQQSLLSDSLNQGKSTSMHFWGASGHLEFLDSLASDWEISDSWNHPNQTVELRPAQAASHLITSTCLAMEPTQGATHFSENLFIKEDSCAKQHLFSRL
jgi:hypothetical protein